MILDLCREWGKWPGEFDDLPIHYQAELIAFVGVKGWVLEKEHEQRKREQEVLKGVL